MEANAELDFDSRAGKALRDRGLQPGDISSLHNTQLRVDAKAAWLARNQAIHACNMRIMRFGLSKKDYPDDIMATDFPESMTRGDMAERQRLIEEDGRLTLEDPNLHGGHYKED